MKYHIGDVLGRSDRDMERIVITRVTKRHYYLNKAKHLITLVDGIPEIYCKKKKSMRTILENL